MASLSHFASLTSLVIWLGLLPLALVESTGWIAIFWAPLTAYGLTGMDRMATELSNPFG